MKHMEYNFFGRSMLLIHVPTRSSLMNFLQDVWCDVEEILISKEYNRYENIMVIFYIAYVPTVFPSLR